MSRKHSKLPAKTKDIELLESLYTFNNPIEVKRFLLTHGYLQAVVGLILLIFMLISLTASAQFEALLHQEPMSHTIKTEKTEKTEREPKLATPMNQQTMMQIPKKSPGKALALALSPVFVHGLGQAYNEDVRKSLIFSGLSILGFSMMIYGSQTENAFFDEKTGDYIENPRSGGAAAAGSLIWLSSYIWSSIDAYRLARQKNIQLRSMTQSPKKSPSGALALALIPGLFIHGTGQLYNGDSKKGWYFFGLEMLGLSLFITGRAMLISCCPEDCCPEEPSPSFSEETSMHSGKAGDSGVSDAADIVSGLVVLIWTGSYVWSAFDAYHSARRKNIERGYTSHKKDKALSAYPLSIYLQRGRDKSVQLTFATRF